MGFDFTKQGNFNSRFPDDALTSEVIPKKTAGWTISDSNSHFTNPRIVRTSAILDKNLISNFSPLL